MNKICIIFDLDGTLVDSAPSILSSLKNVFANANLTACRPLSPDLIGPPLEDIVQTLLLPKDKYYKEALVSAFKKEYDNAGYKLTRIYQGVPAMLKSLTEDGIPLVLATNKRIIPTSQILAQFGWMVYFKGVFALDSFTPPLLQKADMLIKLSETLNGQSCIYVGDRVEDAQAAQAAKLPFVMASWGYGDSMNANCQYLKHPNQLRASTIAKLLQ